MTQKIISNTEITAYNTCSQLHDYMYNQEIEPRVYPLHIRRGQIGHAMLEAYYTHIMNGSPTEVAKSAAKSVIIDQISKADPTDFEYVEMLADLQQLMNSYFNYYANESMKILAVEKVIIAPLSTEIDFGLYADLIVEITTGPFKGEVQIWDHKFISNFKSDDDLRIDGQQTKYIKAAQLSQLPIKRAVFNQIRYRKMKDPKPEDLFRRSPLLSSKETINNIWQKTTDTADEIVNDSRKIRRTLSYSACKYCFVKSLCMAELAGEPTETMRIANYRERKRPFKDWMLSNG